jgi:RNA polymerase sigma factor (sigma-70 family)
MSPRQRRLILDHLGHVKHTAQGIRQGALPRDELVAAGNLALVQAAHDFDPERGTTFWPWAYRRVYGAMWDAVRAWTHYDHGSRTKPERVLVIHELGEDEQPCVRAQADATYIVDALKALPPRQARVLVCRFFAGYTLEELAADEGVTPSRISQISAQARRLAAVKMRVA